MPVVDNWFVRVCAEFGFALPRHRATLFIPAGDPDAVRHTKWLRNKRFFN
jgi:hypothetical protein